MATRLIRLKDGILVEVDVTSNEAQQINGGLAEKVDATFNAIKPVLLKTCRPVVAALHELRSEIDIEHVEVELGLSFEGEGNIYIAKAHLGANLTVRMTLKGVEEGGSVLIGEEGASHDSR